MISSKETLNELFEFLPKKLEEVGKSDGNYIYSNKDITEKVYTWLGESHNTRKISDKIKEGIEKKIILIGYTNRSVFSFLMKKTGSWALGSITGVSLRHVAGWYSRRDNNIVITLSHKNVSLTGKVVTEIPSVLTHELSHMCAYRDKNNYYNTFRKDLVRFYYEYISDFLKKDLRNNIKEIDRLVERMIVEFESTDERNNPHHIFNIWGEFFEKIGYDKNEQIKDVVLRITSPYLVRNISSMRNKYKKSAKNARESLYKAYGKLGYNVRNLTDVYQESIYPSEVLCIINQFNPSPDMIKSINNLRF
jgi:hypothetical protein